MEPPTAEGVISSDDARQALSDALGRGFSISFGKSRTDNFQEVKRFCRQLPLPPDEHDKYIYFAAKTITQLRCYIDKPLGEVVEHCWPQQGQPVFPSENFAHYIALTLFAWLRLFAGTVDNPTVYNMRHNFDAEMTVRDNIIALLPADGSPLTTGSAAEIDFSLTAANLAYFYGVKMVWTSFVNHHLELKHEDNGERQLLLFSESTNLSLLHGTRPFTGFFEEVFATMHLLFPSGKASRSFLKKTNYPGYISEDSFALSSRLRSLHNFPYFAERLAKLIDIHRGPTTHWWHFLVDRRNKREHATQLIALWAFLFAFLSLVFGLISAIYGIKQYALGIAAACAENGDHPALRSYCPG